MKRDNFSFDDVTIEQFWKRFYNEYTLALRERLLYDKTKRDNSNLAIGDVVVIKDDKRVPRTKWKHGRVESLLIGRDGIVRGAVLRTYQENGKTILIKRALQRLIPLEITNNQLDDEQLPPERTRREAAVTGEIIRQLTN